VTALDTLSGEPVWSMTMGFRIEAPLAAHEHVLVASGNDGRLAAIDCTTVKPHRLWTRRVEGRTAGASAISAGRLLIGTDEGTLHCLDLKTGRPLWTYQTEGPVRGTPSADAGCVFVGDDAGFLHAVALEDGASLWSRRIGRQVRGAPALAGGSVVAVGLAAEAPRGAVMACLEAASGKERWSRTLAGGDPASPSVGDERVFLAVGNRLTALELTDGSEAWTLAAEAPIRAAPTISGARLYVGADDRRLRCLDQTDGRELWSVEAGWYIPAGPAVFDGRLFFADNRRTLHCLKTGDAEAPDWPQFGGGPERGGYNRGVRIQLHDRRTSDAPRDVPPAARNP
jgi:outer membrane protein assembly factor BamB